MFEKEIEFLFNYSPCDRDEAVTYESRKRGVDNSFQFDRIMKSSKPSPPTFPKLLNSTAYFEQKGCFEQLYIDIETRNNYPKSNLPTLTIIYTMNLRKTQKDVEKDVLNYVDTKILAQVNCIKNPSEKEIEEAKNKDPNSDFVYCTFPTYQGEKLRGIDEHICIISVLGDRPFITNGDGFSIGDEKQPLWSGYGRKKLPNPLSCTADSFMKRPIKNRSYNREGHCEILCYTPQLCDRMEKASIHNNKAFVPFIEVNKESFGQGFHPIDLLISEPEKKSYARNSVRNIVKMMCKENKAIITQNLKKFADTSLQ